MFLFCKYFPFYAAKKMVVVMMFVMMMVMIVVRYLYPPIHKAQKACWTSCCELKLYKKINNSLIVLSFHSVFHCALDEKKHPISFTGPVSPSQLDFYFLSLIMGQACSLFLHCNTCSLSMC